MREMSREEREIQNAALLQRLLREQRSARESVEERVRELAERVEVRC